MRANVKNRSPRTMLEVAATHRTTRLGLSVSPPSETDGTLSTEQLIEPSSGANHLTLVRHHVTAT